MLTQITPPLQARSRGEDEHSSVNFPKNVCAAKLGLVMGALSLKQVCSLAYEKG